MTYNARMIHNAIIAGSVILGASACYVGKCLVRYSENMATKAMIELQLERSRSMNHGNAERRLEELREELQRVKKRELEKNRI